MIMLRNPNSLWYATPFHLNVNSELCDDETLKAFLGEAKEEASETKEKETQEQRVPTYLIRNFNVLREAGDSLILSADLPGVKAQDVSITEHGGKLTIEAYRKNGDKKTTAKFTRAFELDKRTMDPSHVTASLEDGVLTLTIQKRAKSVPVNIQPLLKDAPKAAGSDSFRFELEIPGVKPSDLDVTLVGDEISIVAKRKRDGSATSTKRTFSVDDEKVDVSCVEAYHADGILTLVAPKKEEVTAAASRRSIPVNMELTGGSEQTTEQGSEVVLVETDEAKSEQTP